MRLIDADALWAQMKEFHEKRAEEANMTGDRVVCVTWHDAVIFIKNAPTVNVPDREVGKWIWMGDTGDSRWMCSVCKSKENVPTIMGEPAVWEFCPNCGSEMKGEDDV